ncbi:MAG: hypothetical protein WDW38_010571 [Sanguina aurantia]
MSSNPFQPPAPTPSGWTSKGPTGRVGAGKPLSPSSMLASAYFDAAGKATTPSASQAALGIAAAIAAVDAQDVMGDIQFFTSLTTHQPPQQQQQQQQQKRSPQQQPWQSDVQQMFTMGSPTPTPPPAAAAAAAAAEPTGPPPLLQLEDDDIYWVSKLHSALSSRAFYPSDEEVEGWFFGEGTQGAVMAFQASEQLAETGGAGGRGGRKGGVKGLA